MTLYLLFNNIDEAQHFQVCYDISHTTSVIALAFISEDHVLLTILRCVYSTLLE